MYTNLFFRQEEAEADATISSISEEDLLTLSCSS